MGSVNMSSAKVKLWIKKMLFFFALNVKYKKKNHRTEENISVECGCCSAHLLYFLRMTRPSRGKKKNIGIWQTANILLRKLLSPANR